MPTLTQLEYIVAVDEHRHFGKAAEHCHVSQPSLSMQIQKAEEQLGAQIFDRFHKPVLVTEVGSVIIAQAKKILRDHEELLQISKSKAEAVSGDFKLGIIPTLAPYVLPLFLKDFSETYSQVNLYIEELTTEKIIDSLEKDQIDCGLLATPVANKSLVETPLFYEPFYVYAHEGHALLRKSTVDSKDLRALESAWVLQDGHCFRNQMLNLCHQEDSQGALKNVHFESGNLETVRRLVKSSYGYTLLPHLFVDQLTKSEFDKCVRPFQKPIPTREISLVQRRGHWKTAILAALKTVILKHVPHELSRPKVKDIEIIEF